MVESQNKCHKCFCDWGFGLLLLLFHTTLLVTIVILVEKSSHSDSFYIGSYTFNIKTANKSLPTVLVTETIEYQVIGTFSSIARTFRFSNNTIETGLPSPNILLLSHSSPNITKLDLNIVSDADGMTWIFSFPPRSSAAIFTYTYEADLLFNVTKDEKSSLKFNYLMIDDSWTRLNGSVWGFSKIDVDFELPYAELTNLTTSRDLYGQAQIDNTTKLYFKQDYLGLGRSYGLALDFVPSKELDTSHETKKILGIDWWIFLIAGGVVVLAILAVVISYIVKTKRQKKVLILERQ